MTDREFEFGVFQGGIMVASAGSRNRDEAFKEAMHYAAIYSQDGPVIVREVTGEFTDDG
jgi:hypothetical protein